MKNPRTILVCALAGLLLAAAPALAGVNVHVGLGIPIPAPVVVVPAPPPMVVIPGTPVYYAPGLNVDIFFYGGWWWHPYQGHWWRSRHYGGPWGWVERPPRPFLHLPPHYRDMSRHQRHIPYGQFQKHWREWEWQRRNPNWDKGGWKKDPNHYRHTDYYQDRGYRPDRDYRPDDRGDRHNDRGNRGHDRGKGQDRRGGRGR